MWLAVAWWWLSWFSDSSEYVAKPLLPLLRRQPPPPRRQQSTLSNAYMSSGAQAGGLSIWWTRWSGKGTMGSAPGNQQHIWRILQHLQLGDARSEISIVLSVYSKACSKCYATFAMIHIGDFRSYIYINYHSSYTVIIVRTSWINNILYITVCNSYSQ